ncbi:hypothetical protein [Melittangium boletus]|uniref:Uncharacterized protein n=1 Tax=Melittangium boletus DSM 14713 TaxID=1294270 RepID=A0A250IBS6_9BACT|nr:hypothetical protein [Melittangium boletus]ATB28622.1 hypothetical protein MEBOL_002071 [Melittangium boletus DSM 14713]
MYCASCRQERLGGQLCAACGEAMESRDRDTLEQEIAHIDFLLEELEHWDSSAVPQGARNYLVQRYERQCRILRLVIAETRPQAVAPAPVVEAPAPAPVPVSVPLVEEVKPEPEPMRAEAPVAETPEEKAPEVDAPEEDVREEAESFSYADFRAEEAREAKREARDFLPPVTTEPLFEAPVRRTNAARLVEEVSTWDTVWKPFLYESIGWFIGAFLIVAGSLYLAFDSWAGLTSFSRSLVVFGMTAGYSAAFSVCGALLCRRDTLASAGRILGLIGAAVAPFAGLALGPVGGLGLDGISPVLLVPLLLGWAFASATLVRKPAEAFDAPSRPLLQGALVGTTLMMGLAPLAARMGGFAFWLDVLPCVFFFVLARQSAGEDRDGKALAFVLGAPAYLLLLFVVRLHLALGVEGASPALGSYAPFLAFLLATCLRFRELDAEESADSLSVGVAALQVGCVVAAATGSPPAFFLTAATFVWTVFGLSQGAPGRLPWLYAVYAGVYLAYTSVDQLLPGGVRDSLDAFRASWFDGASGMQVRAFSALPFVVAGTVGAGWLLSRDSEDDEARAEILLRSTAIASPLFVLASHVGTNLYPAFWCTLALMVLCVASGWRFERLYLSLVGAGISALLAFSAPALFGPAVGAVVCGGIALGFAWLPRRSAPRAGTGFHVVAGWLSSAGFFFSLQGGTHAAALVGMGLSGAAMLLVAWNLANPYLLAVAACGAAAVVPKLASFAGPEWVPPALALAACGLSVLSGRAERLRMLAGSGVSYALLAFIWGVAGQVPWFGVTVLLAAAAVGVASMRLPDVRPLAVILGGVALLSRVGFLHAWPWMTPGLSMALFVLWSLGASVIAARRGRDASTFTAGVVALVYPVAVAFSASRSQPYPLALGGMLAALFTARSLHPSLAVVCASLWTAMLLGKGFRAPHALGVATILSLIALLESNRTASRVLAGGRRFALAATLCAMPFLLVACVLANRVLAPLVLVGTVVLPWVWTRANREPFFAALSPLWVLLLLGDEPRLKGIGSLLPLFMLGMVRAAEHLPAARRLLLGREEDAVVHRLSAYMQGALTLVGVLAMWMTRLRPEHLAPLVSALVLLPGPLPSVRVALSAGLLSLRPALHPVGIVLLLALGFLAHHLPLRLARFFRAPRDERLLPVSVVGALVLALASLVVEPSQGAILVLSGVLLVGTFLLSQGWMLTVSLLTFAGASLGRTPEHVFLEWRPEAALAFVGVALASAVLSALCQRGSVQRVLSRLAARVSPGLESTWSEPLWFAGAIALAIPVVQHLGFLHFGGMPLGVALLGGLTALVLMVTRERLMANVATALLAGVLLAAIPPLWSPAVLSGTGLLLCMAGTWLDKRDVDVGVALHHAGWMMSLASVLGLRSLTHPGTPACVLLGLGSAWAVVYRRREREWVGWLASLVVQHLLLSHVGAVFSTGKGAALILPLFGAGSALLATLALSVAGERVRRSVGHAFAQVAMVEILLGLMLVSGSPDSVRGALIACVSLAVLFFALVRRAIREEDETSAFLAQGTLVFGYLSARLHAVASGLGTADSLVALAGGVLFSGLYVLAQREGAGLPAFRRPALWGAFLFPMAGLLTAPWHQPLYVAALLVGHAAHFAALASHPSQRGVGSLVSAAAFNAALVMVWMGTGAGDPQFYVIPAGISLLVLLWVFRDSMDPDTQARLRAVAITLIYVAGSWRAVVFQEGHAMMVCVFVCVVGVVAGVALRIRSYVYLGSAFLVTCVVANLARFGTRDHRAGAVFLSLLGIGVVGFMVLFTAKRAELLSRYERVRAMLDTWEG